MGRHTHIAKRWKEHIGSGWQLLPGIPNEITLDLITPKLQWKAFLVLSSVSRSWRKAIQTKQVYEARVRANSTETLIVLLKYSAEQEATLAPYSTQQEVTLALYSTGEKRCYELPPIGCLPRGSVNVRSGHCIALDGKLYVFGGERVLRSGRGIIRGRASVGGCDSRGDVFMLDLAGQKEWKQCASMLEARSHFGCGVMDGKIYIFGGINEGDGGSCHPRSEVYDPHKNSWSSIMPMPMSKGRATVGNVATIGKELFLYHGLISNTLVYNPAKNEWRVVEYPVDKNRFPVFIANEKLYSFYRSGIDVYDEEQQAWINWKTNSFTTVTNHERVVPLAILAVKDELLVTGMLLSRSGRQSFQSKGFDTDKEEMVWEGMDCPFIRLLCSSSIQL